MKEQSIENIEQDYWQAPAPDASGLIRQLYSVRKKSITDLSVEDLRLLIGQNVCLSNTVPTAINILKDDLFAEGDYYPGDLLVNLLTSDKQFWAQNPILKQQVESLCADLDVIIAQNCDLSETTEREILKAFAGFLNQ